VNDPQPRAAIVQRLLPASPAVVYDEWLDPEALADWMCPRPAIATSIDLDPTVGGSLRIDIEEDGRRFFVAGRYVELERPRLLRFTWSCSTWPDPSVESLVTVTLEAHGDSDTLMTIHHAMLPPDLISQHRSGWEQIAEQLAEELAGSASTMRTAPRLPVRVTMAWARRGEAELTVPTARTSPRSAHAPGPVHPRQDQPPRPQ
jgi:uncharacterized protein YndB with AHSA1/START domain